MKTLINLFLLVLVAILIAGCSGGDKHQASNNTDAVEGTVSVSGAFALYPLVNVWAEEFSKEYPGVRINVSAGGAGKGMADVLSGATDIAMLSRDINNEEKQKGAWWIAVTKDAVLATISSSNPLRADLLKSGLTQKELSGLFLGTAPKKWRGSGAPVNVYTRSDAAGAAEVWAKYLGGDSQESLKGIAVYGDPGVADAVRKDPNGIGYNNVIYVYDVTSGNKYPGIDVVPIDINANGKIDPDENFYENLMSIDAAIASGKYPSPPARELFLVSRGAPQKRQIKLFLDWILTTGQQFVDPNGYIRLNADTLKAQQARLR